MKKADDIKHVKKKHSFNLAVVAALLGVLELLGHLQAVLPLWKAVLPPGWFAALASIVALSSAAAQLYKQRIKGRDY